MDNKDMILGVLERGGFIRVNSGKILLTRISREEAQNPEMAALRVSEKDIGKMALVAGVKSGDVIYSANIVEILSPVTGMLVKSLSEKGIISLDDLKSVPVKEKPYEKETMKKRLCALVIGHKKYSPGAVNEKLGITEFDFNDDLAVLIEKKVRLTNVQRIYRRTYRELPGDINALAPDFVVSLHCNAFNKKASGTEVLYYYRSAQGKKMAEVILRHLVDFLELPNRGIKPKTAEDRGGYLLRYTSAPCVIAEPFFIDNDKDLARALSDRDGLAEAYARAIDEISQTIV